MNQKINFRYKDEENNRVYDCPFCGSGEVRVAENVFYGQCSICDATIVDYQPLPYQEDYHKSTAQYKLAIGGYATGKTTMSCAEIAMHAQEITNGRSLITGPTLSLIKDAVIPELDKFIPPWIVEHRRMNPTPYYKLKNGHEILIYPSTDQQKLRSLNLSAFYIEEASAIDYEIFDQLMTRLRHKSAIIYDELGNEVGYKYLGLVSTNPEEGWIKDKFLFVASKVFASKSIDRSIYEPLMSVDREKHFHAFLSSTRDNHHKPRDFIERISAGKSREWIRVYIDCYLDRKEGAIYPEFSRHVIEPFKIPNQWLRIAGFDKGYTDGTALVVGVINPRDGVIYIYDEYFETEKPISYHAKKIREKVAGYQFYNNIQADPTVKQRNDRDGISYSDYFYKLSDVILEPANNQIDFGIEKVRDYLHSGKLKIFNSCQHLRTEAQKYVFMDNSKRNSNDKPVDKDNHLMDALRYMIVKLPRNPMDMEDVYSQEKNAMALGHFLSSVKDDDDFGFTEQNIFGGMKYGR